VIERRRNRSALHPPDRGTVGPQLAPQQICMTARGHVAERKKGPSLSPGNKLRGRQSNVKTRAIGHVEQRVIDLDTERLIFANKARRP